MKTLQFIVVIILLSQTTFCQDSTKNKNTTFQKLPAVLERKEVYTNIIYPTISLENHQVKQFSSNDKKVIRICSPSRHSLESSPLFILDGMEMQKGDSLKINPKDIQSVEVLNDKATIEIYGEKGKNGVILITSKKK